MAVKLTWECDRRHVVVKLSLFGILAQEPPVYPHLAMTNPGGGGLCPTKSPVLF